MDFVGPIKPTRWFTNDKYIFVATNYLIKWVEAKAFKTDNATITTKFIYEYILTRFGCPLTLISNKGVHFINDVIKYFMDHFLMKHVSSTTYYPQGNG